MHFLFNVPSETKLFNCRATTRVLDNKDFAPNVEELVVGGFEEESKKVANKNKNEKFNWDFFDTKGCQDDSGHILQCKNCVQSKLVLKTFFLVSFIVLFLFG